MKPQSWCTQAGIGLFLGTLALPVAAHQVKIDADVGATLHIEPNDVAQAGTPTQVWFALTQPGGVAISLADCDCSLTVVDADDHPIATPTLTALSAEGYEAIPAATVTFPTVGSYTLLLAGRPATGASFNSFDLAFPVTVATQGPAADPETQPLADAAIAPPPADNSATSANAPVAVNGPETPAVNGTSGWVRLLIPLGGIGLLVVVLLSILGGRRSPGGKT